ncbi:MAG: hypothetical protein P4M15_15460 [Alphaproteobacteria bacterium]|nr:hypothetical protein [Alphaproteobacteria bacterium]
MRFAAFALMGIGLSLAALPAHAEGSGFVFNGFFCPQQVACNPGDPSFPATHDLISMVSACVVQNLSVRPGGTYFNEIAGLNSNGCLTAESENFPVVAGTRSVPICCVTQIPEGGCAVHCRVQIQ